MSKSKPLSAFAKALNKSYNTSKAGTKAAEKVNIVQSDKLRVFTSQERTGKPSNEIHL